ncbi:MAG: hypothetical protein DMF63_10415 [Acidobacteria bacterium]|nr:MAG: hypothetical protein DMF63_10415 [Acidobacteriota bacterium]
MWCSFIPARLAAVPFCVLILIICFSADSIAQTSDPKFLSAPDFKLSAEAVSAGIDGAFKVALSIDEEGNVKSVRMYGDPVWPCDTSPKREIEAVRDAVEAHLRLLKFSPAMKNGKPRKSEVMLEFAIGDAFKHAVAPGEAKNGSSPKLVKGGVLNGRAIRLVKPLGPTAKGIVDMQVLINEQGNVSKAGALAGNPALFTVVREAACASKFSPTSLGGTPVKVTGVITYVIQ